MGGNLPLEFLEEVHQLTVWETGVNLPQTPDLSYFLYIKRVEGVNAGVGP